MKFIKKLPKIYQNEINKHINNNKKIHKINNKDIECNYLVKDVLDSIFNTKGYVFNKEVIIKTNDNLYDTYIVSKNNNYLLTIDNDKIDIDDILYMKRKK